MLASISHGHQVTLQRNRQAGHQAAWQHGALGRTMGVVALQLKQHPVALVHEADAVHGGTVVVGHHRELQPGRQLVVPAGDEVVGLGHITEEVEGAPSEACHDGIVAAAAACVLALYT